MAREIARRCVDRVAGVTTLFEPRARGAMDCRFTAYVAGELRLLTPRQLDAVLKPTPGAENEFAHCPSVLLALAAAVPPTFRLVFNNVLVVLTRLVAAHPASFNDCEYPLLALYAWFQSYRPARARLLYQALDQTFVGWPAVLRRSRVPSAGAFQVGRLRPMHFAYYLHVCCVGRRPAGVARADDPAIQYLSQKMWGAFDYDAAIVTDRACSEFDRVLFGAMGVSAFLAQQK